MPEWLFITLGVFGGVILIGAAVFFLAFGPELKGRPKRSWMAKPSGDDNDRQPIAGIGPD
jgi:hypothetical protein